METWITRDKRLKKSQRRRILILILLLAIASGLTIKKFYPGAFNYMRHIGKTKDNNSFGKNGDIVKLGQSILQNLGLEHLEINKQPYNFLGQSTMYPCYEISWPGDFPFVWLTRDLQIKCGAYDDLGYDALELGNNDRLVVWLIEPFDLDTLAEFEFVSNSRTVPRVSSISFVFKDFADFKRQEALDLIWLNIPFGYVLKADQVPDDVISKALKSSQGQCFLELPADTAGWTIILNGHRLLNHIPDNEFNESNLRTILEIFPVLDAIYFQKSDEPDRELVRLIIGLAGNLRLTYLLENDSPGFADSLAYLKGLKIKRMVDVDKDIILGGKELRSLIISRINDLTRSDKGLYYIPGWFDEVESIKSFLPLFEKLNIKIALPLRMAQTIENL